MPLERRKGKFGSFWGCSAFPRCDFTMKLLPGQDAFDLSKVVQEQYNVDIPPKIAKLFLRGRGTGVVYFIRIKKNNLIKIGNSIDYIARLQQLDAEHGGIVPVLLIKTKFYQTLEKFFHDLFNDFLRDKCEYFEIPAEYLVEVANIKSFLGDKIKILKKEKIELAKLLSSKIKVK